MTQVFVPGTASLSFSGAAVLTSDPATGSGASYEFANIRVEFNYADNNGYPDVIDSEAYQTLKAAGVVMGAVRLSFVLLPDRRPDQLFATAFGQRTGGQLPPWILTAYPFASATPFVAPGIWWSTLRLYASFSTQGAGAMVMGQMTGMVMDPHNVTGATAAAIPASAGTPGAGISSFARASFTNDGATTYDQVRAFDFALTNNLQVQPSIKDQVNRLAAGCTPGTIKGALTLTQLKGANNPIPQGTGVFPIDIVTPTGDGTHKITTAGSWSWDSNSTPLSPTDFYQCTSNFSLFATIPGGSTGSANNPWVMSYA